jgi:hypothetical protein
MAIVLALMIVGWLVAFALGSQAGFDTQSEPAQSSSVEQAQTTYREPASIA